MAKFETIKMELDNESLKETINLFRKLKYEIVEMRKAGLNKRTINKIIRRMSK